MLAEGGVCGFDALGLHSGADVLEVLKDHLKQVVGPGHAHAVPEQEHGVLPHRRFMAAHGYLYKHKVGGSLYYSNT